MPESIMAAAIPTEHILQTVFFFIFPSNPPLSAMSSQSSQTPFSFRETETSKLPFLVRSLSIISFSTETSLSSRS
jgi:hypothetical protein